MTATTNFWRRRSASLLAATVMAVLVTSIGIVPAASADTDTPSGEPVAVDDGMGAELKAQEKLRRSAPAPLEAASVPARSGGQLFGIDIATSQTNIDLQAFKAGGGQFTIIKMGGGNASDSPYVAPAYQTQLARARAAGLLVGHYWMNGDRNGLTPTAAADYFVAHSDIRIGEVVALDIEAIDGVAAYTPAQAAEWIQRVQRTYPGLKVLLYLNQAAVNGQDWSALANAGNPLWVAVWGSNNGEVGNPPELQRNWADWALWQYSSRGVVSGFGGAVDVNLAKADTFTRYGWAPVDRLAGSDRFGTAVAVSKRAFPNGNANVAYVANALSAPDALSAAPAAAKENGPVLLALPDAVPEPVLSELRRLKPKSIRVVGGEQAISAAVVGQLSAIAPVVRFAGDDRFATSLAVASAVFPTADKAFIATGLNFADALTGAAAISSAGPMLLVDGQSATADTATLGRLAAMGVKNVYIAGGMVSVSEGIANSIANQQGAASVMRLSGPDRFETAVAINAEFFKGSSPATFYLATGSDFADALTGGALAALQHAPLYLSRQYCIPGSTYDVLRDKATDVVLLGGVNALSENVARLGSC